MISDFNQFDLSQELAQAVADCGYTTPMPIQAEMIPLMLTGEDVIGQAQTGTGKTAAFALPILQNLEPKAGWVQALVLAPTRELALQVAEAFNDYGRRQGVRVLPVYGGQSYAVQMRELRRGVDVVVGTPGRLMDLMERGVLDLSQVSTVVIDEADEMMSMGFLEDVEKILSATPEQRQTALFSATMPAEIRRLAQRFMQEPRSVTIQSEHVTGDSIEQRYYLVYREDKLAALTRLFETEDVTRALIFARTRAGTSDLANNLNLRGYPAEALNGDLSQDARERILSRFRNDQIKVLVATDIAARGLDIDGISHVFNYELPDDPEVYVHRIGRTGRAGKSGIAVSLVTPGERRHLRNIETLTRQKIERAQVPSDEDIINLREEKLLAQVNTWLLRGRCKRERTLVENLVEMGHDPMDVAAAAVKLARAEEKQRPLDAVQEVVEREPRRRAYGRGEYRSAGGGAEGGPAARHARYRSEGAYAQAYGSRGAYAARGEYLQAELPQPPYRDGYRSGRSASEASHEPGMVRLSLRLGRMHGIRPKDIIGTIAYHADIPGNVIGKITIQDDLSYVDVPEAYVGQVLTKNKEMRFRRQALALQKAS